MIVAFKVLKRRWRGYKRVSERYVGRYMVVSCFFSSIFLFFTAFLIFTLLFVVAFYVFFLLFAVMLSVWRARFGKVVGWGVVGVVGLFLFFLVLGAKLGRRVVI